MPLAVLLLATDIVELHDFHHLRVIEIRHGRVIERDVAVFAHAKATEVDRLGGKQFGVALTFAERFQCIALELMKYQRIHAALHTLAHVTPETCTVVGVQPKILIHMKKRDLAPVYFADG